MKPINERMSIPELIIYVSKYMFERELIDPAGGNISARDDSNVYMTPTLAGNSYHWDFGWRMSWLEMLKIFKK